MRRCVTVSGLMPSLRQSPRNLHHQCRRPAFPPRLSVGRSAGSGDQQHRRKPPPPRVASSSDSSSDSGGGEDVGSTWSRRILANRQLELAMRDEDYALCQSLKTEIAALEAQLPPQKQVLLALLGTLRRGAGRERVAAAQALGDLGDAAALPALQDLLGEEDVGGVCEASMWSIFMKPTSAEVEGLMQRGMAAMNRPSEGEAAVAVFTQMIAAAPSYAEGYNKRATTLYLLQRHREAVDDCRATLALNPYHFGAASGMGMCCAALQDYQGAIAAFEAAVGINPRLGHLRHHITQLRALKDRQAEQ